MSDANEEQALRIELMKTQIEHLRGQITWEPWKAMATAFAAGGAVVGALAGILALILHYGK